MVQTEYGAVEGVKRDGCAVYMGIPFAKPPIGELAFKHPVRPEPWGGVLCADHGGKNPVQAEGAFRVKNNDLDCLCLNVFVPEHGEEALPVMVWIYGGAYAQGGAGAKEPGSQNLVYNLCRFAIDAHAVVVSFNYRMNLYGFLNLHDFDDRFDCNNGLYDQLLAIRFVKENIAAFGGNPENITLFGQSAGASCILALMGMDEAKGLFHKAIVQSAVIEHFFTEKESRAYTKRYLRIAGVSDPAALGSLSRGRIMWVNRVYAFLFLMGKDIRCAFSPVIDGVTLRDEPKKLAQVSTVPLLIGCTAQEGNLFVPKVPVLLLPVIEQLIHIKSSGRSMSLWQRFSDALTEHIFLRPMEELLSGYRGPAWRYQYAHEIAGSKLGSCHASEISVLFDYRRTLDGAPIPGDDQTGAVMRRAWGAFAASGDPGWTSYKEKKEVHIFP